MATGYTWLLNGIDLDVETGHLAAVTLWRPPISTRRSPVTIPGMHGSLTSGLPVFEDPQIVIGIRTTQTTQAALEEAVNMVAALLTQPTLTVTRVSGGLTTSARAELVSADMDNDFLAGGTSAPVAVLSIPGVFFRDTAAVSTDFPFTADLVNQEVATLSGSTGPIGDAVIRITGACTNPVVTDPGTGTGISYAGTVASGQYLFMSARPLSARISSSASDWLSGGSDVSPAVSFPAAGRLQLWPVVQSATVRKVLLSATGTGRTGSPKLAVRGQRSYL